MTNNFTLLLVQNLFLPPFYVFIFCRGERREGHLHSSVSAPTSMTKRKEPHQDRKGFDIKCYMGESLVRLSRT